MAQEVTEPAVQRASRWLTRGTRFAVTGGLATLIHVAIAYSFLRAIAPIPILANGIAFVAATAFSYAINTTWTFTARHEPRSLLRFGAVALVGLLATAAISGGAELAGWSYWSGIALVVVCVPPLTFTLHALWTYR